MSKSKHVPERTCVACRKKGCKEEFFKLVENRSGEITYTNNSKVSGRGIYICKDFSCINKAGKFKKKQIKSEIVEKLSAILKKCE